MAAQSKVLNGFRLLLDGLGKALRDAIIVTLICSAVALVINTWLHPEGIPFIAQVEYETLVPCPVPGGPVEEMSGSDPRLDDSKTFVVDARVKSDFEKWHHQRAMNVVYDFLDPTPESVLKELAGRIARSRSVLVVIYGDGQNPDTGELLAKEISAAGIKHVHFVPGGAGAMGAPGAAAPRKDEPGQDDPGMDEPVKEGQP